MMPLSLTNPRTILCLGCHPDDIEIGCGGTVLKLLEQHPQLTVWWGVLSSEGVRADEARRGAELFLTGAAAKHVVIRDFRDRYFPLQYEQVKDFIHSLAREVQPDVVFTHRLEDVHQDHRLIAELTWNAFRNHLVLEYEIPKYEGDLGKPNVLVPLTAEQCQTKIASLHEAFASQRDKPWFTEDTFWALLRLRGLECNSPTRFAEGLYCRKMVL
ncbi:MAG: PIG-L family deacetylase [Planctomycetia bacterium]|nr:PIG-L family deacetylase [Planctomycetia bacterium]